MSTPKVQVHGYVPQDACDPRRLQLSPSLPRAPRSPLQAAPKQYSGSQITLLALLAIVIAGATADAGDASLSEDMVARDATEFVNGEAELDTEASLTDTEHWGKYARHRGASYTSLDRLR